MRPLFAVFGVVSVRTAFLTALWPFPGISASLTIYLCHQENQQQNIQESKSNRGRLIVGGCLYNLNNTYTIKRRNNKVQNVPREWRVMAALRIVYSVAVC